MTAPPHPGRVAPRGPAGYRAGRPTIPETPRAPEEMTVLDTPFTVRLAETEADLLGAQRLRYRVFVEELGGDGALVDHACRLERDAFDPHFGHLVLVDTRRDPRSLDHVAGVYRLMDDAGRAAAGRFYSEDEYDLSPLLSSGRPLMELGRSCVDARHRGGPAMFLLWQGLAAHVLDRGIEVLFGVASFHGADPARHADALSLLRHRHLAPEALRVRARPEHFQRMDLTDPAAIDAAAAMKAMPALIKGYLRLGGTVGEGAFVDHAFNTVDVCLVLDTARMNAQARAIYTRGLG